MLRVSGDEFIEEQERVGKMRLDVKVCAPGFACLLYDGEGLWFEELVVVLGAGGSAGACEGGDLGTDC